MFRVVAIATILLAGGRASADDTLPGGLTLKFDRLLIHENGGALGVPSSPNEATWHYFNKAHCTCALKNKDNDEANFALEVIPETPGATVDRPADIWTGTDCTNLTTRAQTCVKLTYASISSISTIQSQNKATVEINLFDLMNPEPDAPEAGKCMERTLSASTWLIADGNADGTDDYFISKAIDTDTLAPMLPTNFRAAGAENAIDINWDAPTGDTTDIYAYQALCAKSDGSAASVKSRPSARYTRSQDLCEEPDNFDFNVSNIDTGDLGDAGAVETPAEGISSFDPAFLCGDQSSPTATSLRITGLENGSTYQVAVLVVDKFGNARGTFFNRLLTPTPATDFWEDLHERGSKVEGGFCLINETYGDDSFISNQLRGFRDGALADSAFGRGLTRIYYATLGKAGGVVAGSTALRIIAGILLFPIVAIALLWHWLTLPGLLGLIALLVIARRMKWRVRRLAPAMTIGVMLLGANLARAEDGFDPNWNEPGTGEGESQFSEYEAVVKWHVGVRVGPYTPQIDAQLGSMDGAPGPYKQMFGGYSILPMLDVERVIWDRHGTLLVGGNLGWLSKKEHAFVDGSLPTDMPRERAKGDTNKFRLIPFAATATYRYTYLDDEYGIPIVPYLKAGLAYYIWWMDAPSGDFSEVCKAGTTGKDCPKDSAYGASLGFQGTLGLAIRAERIDHDAANSMKESGLLHAGFYGELQLAKVDGFGSEKKLAVGDTTWFAGVDFEF